MSCSHSVLIRNNRWINMEKKLWRQNKYSSYNSLKCVIMIRIKFEIELSRLGRNQMIKRLRREIKIIKCKFRNKVDSSEIIYLWKRSITWDSKRWMSFYLDINKGTWALKSSSRKWNKEFWGISLTVKN